MARTTIRAVAADADVSPALVIHHFGSKDRLRQACDEHVVAVIGEWKREAVAAGPGVDPIAALREAEEGPSILLTEGTEGMVRWAVPAAEILSRGVMADELYACVRFDRRDLGV